MTDRITYESEMKLIDKLATEKLSWKSLVRAVELYALLAK